MRLIPLYCHLIFNMIMLILPPATCLHFPAVVCQSVFYHFKVSDDVSLLLFYLFSATAQLGGRRRNV